MFAVIFYNVMQAMFYYKRKKITYDITIKEAKYSLCSHEVIIQIKKEQMNKTFKSKEIFILKTRID